MKTRRSPHNQEILWRALGGKSSSPRPRKRSPISRRKPIFDWALNRHVDPADPAYLERLTTKESP